VIPNAMPFRNPVGVRTDRAVRRTTILCRIALGEDVGAARELIRSTVRGQESASAEGEMQIFARSFAQDGIECEVT
jgi:small conductance mechanosensitive channel